MEDAKVVVDTNEFRLFLLVLDPKVVNVHRYDCILSLVLVVTAVSGSIEENCRS